MNTPPKIISILLGWITPAEFRSELLGDMAEQFHIIASNEGRKAAINWYFTQTIRSMGGLLMHSLVSNNPIKFISALLLGAITIEAVNLIMAVLKFAAFGTPENSPFTVTSAAVLWSFTGALSGGFITNWMLGKRNLFALAVLGLVTLRPAFGTADENNLMLFSLIAVFAGFTVAELMVRKVKSGFTAH